MVHSNRELNCLIILFLFSSALNGQKNPDHRFGDGFLPGYPEIKSRVLQESPVLFSIEVDGERLSSGEFQSPIGEGFLHPQYKLESRLSEPQKGPGFTSRILSFRNHSNDTLELENLVPIGVSGSRAYITGLGDDWLTRATLFRPGYGPVGLIVPDNAWEMGWTAISIPGDSVLSVLARRESWEKAGKRRYSTLLYPGGQVRYRMYAEAVEGDWKDGLERIFRDRWLYDMEDYDNSLYERDDLTWIRDDYLAVLQFAWDKDFIDERVKKGSESPEYYKPFREFFHRFDHLHGGYDIYGIWQGWPRLGLDERNQWDMFRDLPGGTDSLRAVSAYCRQYGSAFFIAYNPWDESTRSEDHMEGMSEIIAETGADGVVLDTRGASSKSLQNAADRAKPGVVMYSEGMAVAKDMPGILSGRVHNAIRISPPLNLNRLIKPEFQVLRVLDLRDGRIRREAAISLFNGYGLELNLFPAARPWWMEEEYRFMGRCLMILRQNSQAFHDRAWEALFESPDSIWINEWQHGDKTLFTILSLKPEGWTGNLVKLDDPDGGDDLHWVSLWDHEEVPVTGNGVGTFLDYHVDPFSPRHSGTRSEGSVQCIAGFPELIKWRISGAGLYISSETGSRMVVWEGNPAYENTQKQQHNLDNGGSVQLPLSGLKSHPEKKIVVQLFEGKEILDECIIYISEPPALKVQPAGGSVKPGKAPEGMVMIQGGSFVFYRGNPDSFIPYPGNYDSLLVEVGDFYMDRYPVTNRKFAEFLEATGYEPENRRNFLKYWDSGSYPEALADHPVVWVSPEDARAYAAWKGLRLPTEVEWQYAAQGQDGRKWPWGNSYDSTACNHATGHTTAVNAYASGKSPFGIEDMVGNVWQLCEDEYDNGSFRFSIIRGGSWFKPSSSWWYIQGGAQPNDRTQMLLRTSPGFDRSGTVGFRCVYTR